MYTECSVQISDFFDYCFLFLCKFFKLHLIAKYFIKIVLTARFVDIFPSLKMKILLNPFDFLLFRHPVMQLKEKNSKKKFLHVYKNECVLRHCAYVRCVQVCLFVLIFVLSSNDYSLLLLEGFVEKSDNCIYYRV